MLGAEKKLKVGEKAPQRRKSRIEFALTQKLGFVASCKLTFESRFTFQRLTFGFIQTTQKIEKHVLMRQTRVFKDQIDIKKDHLGVSRSPECFRIFSRHLVAK